MSGAAGKNVEATMKKLLKVITDTRLSEKERDEPQNQSRDLAAVTQRLDQARRVVVKIGSALLVDGKTGTLKASWLASLSEDLAQAKSRGQEVIIVSSGAIALGRRKLETCVRRDQA